MDTKKVCAVCGSELRLVNGVWIHRNLNNTHRAELATVAPRRKHRTQRRKQQPQ